MKQDASIRIFKVLRPLKAKKQSKGEGHPPIVFERKNSLSYKFLLFIVKEPIITSQWPQMYFVHECITTSAPKTSGFYKKGEANVLSTAKRTLFFLQIFEISFMSATFRQGLVGVSMKTILIFEDFCKWSLRLYNLSKFR